MIAKRPGLLAVLLAVAPAAPSFCGTLTASGSSKNATVTLVPEHASLEAGRPLWVGLHIKLAPEWHTYWKNPGDSGLPTRMRWRLPEGFSAGEFQWPRPERIPAEPLMSYGYGHEVLLLVEIKTPATLAAREVSLGGRVDWLECREACLPGKAELQITLPVAAGPARPLAEWSQAFTNARARLPKAHPNLKAEAIALGNDLTLSVSGIPVPKEAYFFPAKAEVVEHAAAQKLTRSGNSFRLRLTRAVNTAPPERIEGVLEADGQGFEVAAAVRAVAAGKTEDAASPPAASPGLLAAAGSAFLGGLILNLMPCVLPVLSLKVMSFVRHGDSRLGAARHGAAFALGVLAFFWILAGALLVLRAGGQQVGWGFQLQSPPFVALLASLFLLVALNLFGVFEVGQSLTAAANLTSGARGLQASFWNGALATLVATPCTAPFMGSALGFALAQPPLSTLLVFTALGLGMAAPYLLLSLSPRLLKLVPRPGRWMETFKQAMGFPMLGTVVFLVWLFGRQAGVSAMTGLLAALLLVAAGAWLYGRAPQDARAWRLATVSSAAALVAGGLVLGLSQAQAAPAEAEARSGERWETYSEERLVALRQSGTPVFVDFTADWCLTCQVNERVALQHADVRRRFDEKGVVLMKADWTLRDERITRALEALDRQGVPVYALYVGEGRPRLLPEVLTPGLVLRALDAIPQ
jgi:thiol:disulfide interchange protein DsbD